MGRRRSVPGDPPRVRLLRESFADPDSALAELLGIRAKLRMALSDIEQRISRFEN